MTSRRTTDSKLDAFIHEHVLGKRVEWAERYGPRGANGPTPCDPDLVDSCTNCSIPIPHYSLDIDEAWVLAEKYKLTIIHVGDGFLVGKPSGLVYLSDNGKVDLTLEHRVISRDAPRAICLAVKKIVEETNG